MESKDLEFANRLAVRQMMQLMSPGPVALQAIYTAVKLGVPDLLATEAKTLQDLAVATKTDPVMLRRLLRALTSLSIFSVDAESRFRNTRLSETLRSDVPFSICSEVMLLCSPLFWRPIGELLDSILSGRPAFERLHQVGFFEYLAHHPDESELFNSVMNSGSVVTQPEHNIASYGLSRFEEIVDVGGGHGALLESLLVNNPGLRGVLYDLPSVVAGAKALQQGAVASRCKIIGGDFLQSVPGGADAYVLRRVLHDWADEEAGTILQNCRVAVRSEGRIFLIENVITGFNPHAALDDLLMLVLFGGRERTECELEGLLTQAGFCVEMVHTSENHIVIEGRPI